jgi:hypothetical protein
MPAGTLIDKLDTRHSDLGFHVAGLCHLSQLRSTLAVDLEKSASDAGTDLGLAGSTTFLETAGVFIFDSGARSARSNCRIVCMCKKWPTLGQGGVSV